MLSHQSLNGQFSALDSWSQMGLSLLWAERVLPLFSQRFTDVAAEMTALLDKAWENVILKKDSSHSEGLSDSAQTLAPTSNDDPSAGAAIPAGETVVLALECVKRPSLEAVKEVILMAYTTVEMHAYLRKFGLGDIRNVVSGAELRQRKRSLETEPELQDFDAFLIDVIEQLHSKRDLLSIRESLRST